MAREPLLLFSLGVIRFSLTDGDCCSAGGESAFSGVLFLSSIRLEAG